MYTNSLTSKIVLFTAIAMLAVLPFVTRADGEFDGYDGGYFGGGYDGGDRKSVV